MGIELNKRAEKVGIILAKRGVTKVPPVRVGAAFDVSGSAAGFYTSNVMQETIDRLMAVAMKFDDNGELDAWLFHHDVLPQLRSIVESDEGTYVRDVILKQENLWGATSYSPVLREVMNYYFGGGQAKQVTEKKSGFFGLFGKKEAAPAPVAAPSTEPAMLLFITDGQSNDERETQRVLEDAARTSPVYFNMIGVGDPSYFRFIERMADDLPNVGFTNLNNLSMTDDELYDKIVNQEFVDWIKNLK